MSAERIRMRARATLIGVMALALGLLVAAPASARRSGPVIGIGEQQASMFTSKAFNRLEMHDARYLAPWDVLQDPYQLYLLDSWMAAARHSHARIVLGFGHSFRSEQLAHRLPSWRGVPRPFRPLPRRDPRGGDANSQEQE